MTAIIIIKKGTTTVLGMKNVYSLLSRFIKGIGNCVVTTGTHFIF